MYFTGNKVASSPVTHMLKLYCPFASPGEILEILTTALGYQRSIRIVENVPHYSSVQASWRTIYSYPFLIRHSQLQTLGTKANMERKESFVLVFFIAVTNTQNKQLKGEKIFILSHGSRGFSPKSVDPFVFIPRQGRTSWWRNMYWRGRVFGSLPGGWEAKEEKGPGKKNICPNHACNNLVPPSRLTSKMSKYYRPIRGLSH